MDKRIIIAIILVLAVILIAGIYTKHNYNSNNELANPASKYCVEQGYNNTIRTNPDSSQTGYCIFPSGKECEELSYFRGECKNE